MGDPRSLLSTALSPPNLSDIVRTVLELIEASKASFKRDSTWYVRMVLNCFLKNESTFFFLSFLNFCDTKWRICVFLLLGCLILQMGALSAKTDGKNQSEDGELTFLGRVLAHLPVDLKLGKMTVLGHVFGCLDDCLIIGQSGSLTISTGLPLFNELLLSTSGNFNSTFPSMFHLSFWFLHFFFPALKKYRCFNNWP